jgi:hypothetical protein
MKTIKCITVVLLFAAILSSCNEETNDVNLENSDSIEQKSKIDDSKVNHLVEIGSLKNGVPVITVDKQKLIKSVNINHIHKAGFNPEVVDVMIDQIDDVYYLKFTGEKYRVTFYLELNNNQTFMANSTTSCSTSACSNEQLGCIPEYPDNPAGKSGIGTCTPCGNGGDCTKTVSNQSLFG